MRKRLLALLSALVVAVGIAFAATPSLTFAAWANESYWTSKGSGTAEDPYQVSSQTDLENLNDAPSGTWFRLANDISMSGTYQERNVIDSFSGILDGDGHKITGLSLKVAMNDDYFTSGSFIGTINNDGYVMNLTIKDPTWSCVVGTDTWGYGNWGFFCKTNNGTIDHCTIDALNVKLGDSCPTGQQVGLFCYQNFSVIRNCYVKGTINIAAERDWAARGIGGLAYSNSGKIANCITDISISVECKYNALPYLIGTLVGNNRGTLYNCWSVNTTGVKISGNYTAPQSVGTAVGSNTGSINYCYTAQSTGNPVSSLVGDGSGSIKNSIAGKSFDRNEFNTAAQADDAPCSGLLVLKSDTEFDDSDLASVVFQGAYTGIIQAAKGTDDTYTFSMPSASDGNSYALWTVGDTTYQDLASATGTPLNGIIYVTCAKHDKGSATAVESDTATYDGTAKSLTGTVTWSEITNKATGDDAAPPDATLTYSTTTSDWGEAINPGEYNVAVTTAGNYYYKTLTNTKIDGALTIEQAEPAVTLAFNPVDSGIVQQQVEITATVDKAGDSAAMPTGTVTFYADDVQLDVVDLSDGSAACTWTPTSKADYAIKAVYSGDSNYKESTKEETYSVDKGTLTADNFTVSDNGTVTYNGQGHEVTVTAAAGTDLALEGGGTASITVWYQKDGDAATEEAPKDAGTYSILVSVDETANFNAQEKLDTNQDIIINKADASMTVTSDKTTYTYGDSVTLTATLTGVAGGDIPTGAVTFYVGSMWYPAAVVDGTATLTFSGDSKRNAGTYSSVTAVFTAAKDSNYSDITTFQSCPSFTVEQKDIADAVIELDTVTAYDGTEKTVSIISVTVDGLTLAATKDYTIQSGTDKATNAGNHTLTIEGKGNYTGTATATWNIPKATLTEENKNTFFDTYEGDYLYGIPVDPSADFPPYNLGVTFEGELTFGETLTVWFCLADSEDWSTTVPTNVGTYDIGVTIPVGTANFNAVEDPVTVGTLIIDKATPTVTVASDKSGDTSTYEDEVTFTVTVAKAGENATVPTGTVTLSGIDGAAGGIDLTLDGEGKATFTTSDLSVATHTITAAYNPADEETNYQESTSDGLTFTVGRKALTFTVSGTDQVYDGSQKGVTITSTNSKLTGEDFQISYYEVYENGNTLERTEPVTPIGQGKYLYVIDFAEDDTGSNYTLPDYTVPGNTTDTIPDTAGTDGRAGFMTIISGQTSQQQPIYFSSSQVTKYVTDGGYPASENPLTNPNGSTVTYTSSNTGVAEVDNSGNVTIKGAGTTTIRAESTKEGTTPVYATYTLEVTKRPITVTADDKTISYGDGLGYGDSDVTISGDEAVTLSDLSGSLSFRTRYTPGFNVGTYDVTPAGLTSDRYDITFVPGTLTVNEKVLTANDFEVTADSKTYDGTVDAKVTASVKDDSLVNSDSLTVAAEGRFDSAGAGSQTVHWTVTGLTGAKASNYKLADGGVTGTATATIGKATVTIHCAESTVRTYTGSAQSVDLTAMVGSLPFGSGQYTVYYTKDGDKTTEPKDVGEYDVSVELADDAAKNYTVDSFDATLTIQTATQDAFYISGVPYVVYYGDEFDVQANGANGDVTWSVGSGDPATIVNGHVKITGTGPVTLTATSTKAGHADRTATVTFTAEKRILSASAVATDKTYDGNTTIDVTYTLTDVKTDETVSDVAASTAQTPHTADASAGNGKVVYVNGLTLENENYTLQSANITTTVDIAKKEITGFSFTAADKTYDGRTDAEVTSITLAGVLPGDKDDVTLTGGAAFEDANAGKDKTVTYTAAGLTGSKAGNYTLTASSAETTANITAMPITFTVGAATFAYDGNPKPVTVTAVDESGALFTHFEVLYGGDATAPTDAGEYALSVQLTDGVTEGNYSLSFPTDARLTITAVSQEQLTIVGLPGSVEFGASFTLQALGGTGSGGITWESDNTNVTVTADSEDDSRATVIINGAVGQTVKITATKAADGNHEEKSTYVVFVPVAKTVQFTLSNTTTTYNGTPQGVTVATPGEENATYEVTYNGSETKPTDAGTYTVAVTGTGNYAGSAYGLLTINKATLSDLEVTLDGWTYGGDANSPSVTGDTKNLTPVYSYSTADGQQPVNSGTYTVYATLSGDNYETLTAQNTFTIAKRELTATAQDATRTYGEANPTFTIDYEGFANGEDASVLWQAPMATCSAIPTSPAGTYDIVLTGGYAENYAITLVNGKLTVEADTSGTLAIQGGKSEAKVGDTFTVTAAYSGEDVGVAWCVDDGGVLEITPDGEVTVRKEGKGTITATMTDDDRFGSGTATFEVTATKTELILTASGQTVTYNGQEQAITLLSGNPDFKVNVGTNVTVTYKQGEDEVTPVNAGTYTAEYVINDVKYSGTGSFTFTIEPKEVDITISNLEQVYDGQPKGVTVSTEATDYEVTYNGNKTAPIDAGRYSVVVTITDPNYTGRETATLIISGGTVDTDAITITMADRTYGDTATAAVVTGNPDGTDVAVTYSGGRLPGAQTEVPTDAGTYTVTVTITGDNYETATKTAQFTIAKAKLTASVGTYQRAYGQENPAFTVNYFGFKYDDDSSAVLTPVIASTEANRSSTPGDYAITLSGGFAYNYDFTYETGKLTVTQDTTGTLLINGSAPSVIVGGQLQLSATYQGSVVDVTWESSEPSVATVSEGGLVETIAQGETVITAKMNSTLYGQKEAQFTLSVEKKNVNLRLEHNVLTYNGLDQPAKLVNDLGVTINDTELEVSYVLTSDPGRDIDTPHDAGTYTVSWHIESDSYTGSGEATLYIVKADVTLSAADLTKAYGDENPTYYLSGLLGDDAAADSAYQEKLREMFTFSCEADATGAKTSVGEYDITLTLKSGHSLDEDLNYNFTISETPGKLTVNQRAITVTAKDQTIAYTKEITQGADQATVSNLNEGAKLSAVTLTANGTEVGDSTITPSEARIAWDGADVTDNYDITYADGALTITRLPVTVAGYGRPGYLTVSLSESVPGAAFAVTDGEGEAVTVDEATASSDNRSYTLSGAFESGKTYTVTVTADAEKYDLTGSPVEITVTSGGGGGGTVVPDTYAITVSSCENGTLKASATSASEGDVITVTATPYEGYELDAVVVSQSGGATVEVDPQDNGTFTFEMPASDVSVSATFTAKTVSPTFDDVSEGDWFYDAVMFVSSHGLMTGYAGTSHFGPLDELGREQAAQVLYNALGNGEKSPACPLDDVDQTAWYADAVNWAYEKGLLTGYDDGSNRFGVNDSLTREQFASILARVANADLSAADATALDGFSDRADVAEWAVPAMSWAVREGVLGGSDAGDGTLELRPGVDIIRAEMAQMIKNAAEADLLPVA